MRPLAFAAASLIAVLPCAAPSLADPLSPAMAATVAADPLLLAQVPADAQVCVAWNVLEHPGYAGSRFEKFNQLSQRQALTAENIAANLNASFTPMLKEAHLSKAWMDTFSKTLAAASVHGGALYVRHFEVNPENGPMPPTVALLIRAPKDGAALLEDWKKVLAEGQKLPVAAEFQNGVLRLSFNLMGPAEPWIVPSGSLLKNPRFLASTKGLGDNQAVLAYVDAASLVLRLKAYSAWEKAKKGHSDVEFEKLDAGLGLSGLQTLAFAGGFTKDGQWHWDGLVEAPAPRQGALAMMDGSTVSPELLKRVPASAEGFTAVGFDLGASIDAILALAAKEDPNVRPQWDKGLADLKAQMGVDVKATLAGLGSQWLAFSDPMAAGGGIPGVVVVSPLRNAQPVEAALGMATAMGSAMMKQQLAREGNPLNIGFLTDTFRNVTIHRLGIPLVSPGYAVQDNALFLSLMPQAIQGAVRPVKEPLTDSAAYRTLYAQVAPANAKLRVVGYADLARLAPHAYGTGLMLHQWSMGFGEMFTGQPAPAQLPVLADLMPVLGPDLSAVWTDAQGLHLRSKGPFPGATLVAGGIDGLPVIATGAVAAGVLVPVLGKARQNANVMKTSVNARNVDMGATTYGASNKDWYPGWTSAGKRMDGNLSGLVYMIQDGEIMPAQLISPFDGNARPCPTVDWAHATPENLKAVDAWCRTSGCMIFMGDLQKRKSDQDYRKVDLFVDPDKLPDPRKIPVVRGDCSTETISREELDAMLKEQCGADSATLIKLFREGKMLPEPAPKK